MRTGLTPDGVVPSPPPAPAPEGWLVGTPEAYAALDAAEMLAYRIRSQEADLPPQAIPLLQRAEGFLVAARSSALAGHGRAASIFGRIAEMELRAILREYACSGVSPLRVPRHPPNDISVIRMPPDGPL